MSSAAVVEQPSAVASGASPDKGAALIQRIEAELRAQASHGLLTVGREALGEKWTSIIHREPKRFIREDLTIRTDILENFRRRQVFVSDYGSADLRWWRPRNWIDGARRGMRRRLIECLETLKAQGDVEWLRKYPCAPAGNPFVFQREGHRYTYRWHKHVHFIGLLRRVLGEQLSPEHVAMDIGSSYGIFSFLLKSEYPRSRSILVDFPEQLLLAYYFLGSCLPNARIAGVRELEGLAVITREHLEPYDIVLLPVQWYERLAPGTVDLITNFASLGEMQRSWFNAYVQAPVFTHAKYLFTVNRFQSLPTYDTDLTVLDYPVWEPAKRLHFGICPAFSHTYARKRLFWYEKVVYTSQYFEYIGRI